MTAAALPRSALWLLPVVYLAFVSLGLPDGLIGAAWPAMRVSVNAPLEELGLITFTLTLCSALSSLLGERLLRRLATRDLVLACAVLTGSALLGFSLARRLDLMVLLAIPLGLGAGGVDVALNQFVARHYSSRHMNWLHGCWGLGVTTGTLVMGAALARPVGWSGGYLVTGLMQWGVVLMLLLSRRSWLGAPAVQATAGASAAQAGRSHVAALPWLGVTMYFFYVAVEAGIGAWSSTVLVELRGLSPDAAALLSAGFFGAITAGRFATGVIAARLSNRSIVRGGLALMLAGLICFGWAPLPLAKAGLVLLGLGCAPIFPTLMHETQRRFAPALARRVIAYQVGLAYAGAAVGPALLGLCAAHWGLPWLLASVLVLVLCLLTLNETANRLAPP